MCCSVQLLEACVSNCGQDFQKELTTPAFQGEVRSLLLGVSSEWGESDKRDEGEGRECEGRGGG